MFRILCLVVTAAILGTLLPFSLNFWSKQSISCLATAAPATPAEEANSKEQALNNARLWSKHPTFEGLGQLKDSGSVGSWGSYRPGVYVNDI